jgi:aerobic-type carbon monoxide dehydrogenase small subunit (CoxS/CutS family)
MRIKVKVNGRDYERDVEGHLTLLRFLREELGLTGTKEGCGAGECGACTVFLAAEVDGREVETIEGEAVGGQLSALQAAFDRRHAVQCGYCTAGMVMSARELLRRIPKPTVEQIKDGIEGNFCRCTGYSQIIEAILDASGQGDLADQGRLEHV